MINLKSQIANTLKGNQSLTTLLGGPRIYAVRAPNADEYPRITFFEMGNAGANFADDKEVQSDIRFQIDVWSTGSTEAIAGAVDVAMTKAGWFRTWSFDLYEADVEVFHKALRYEIQVQNMEGS